MNCPTCKAAMSFVPANQNWWCNACLAKVEGEAPEGLAGPTADQVAEAKHAGSHAEVAASGSATTAVAWAITDVLFMLPILLFVAAGLLIYSGFGMLGAIIIGMVLLGWIVMG